ALLAGATFTVTPNPLVGGVGTFTVTDGGVNDADGTANGVIQVDKVKLGTYTVTETVAPAGYALDATPSRTVTVSAGNTITDLGTASSNDTSDFHDFLGALRWEKRDGSNSNVLLAGATFTV